MSDVVGETEIEAGLVIKDDSENEFVWIPVGISRGTTKIELSRYVFKADGTINTDLSKKDPSDQLTLGFSNYYTECLKNSELKDTNGNAIAKDIEAFIESANVNGGYYIGRYEARKSNSGNLCTENRTNSVYRGITQPSAAEKARAMYESNDYFESDLINSFAWDTAILFLQTFDNRTYTSSTNSNFKAAYSRQNRLSTEVKSRGTNNLANVNKQDKICNVYDMADNYKEWTTETSTDDNTSNPVPCVRRGGSYGDAYAFVYSREQTVTSYTDSSFRPILYIK